MLTSSERKQGNTSRILGEFGVLRIHIESVFVKPLFEKVFPWLAWLPPSHMTMTDEYSLRRKTSSQSFKKSIAIFIGIELDRTTFDNSVKRPWAKLRIKQITC